MPVAPNLAYVMVKVHFSCPTAGEYGRYAKVFSDGSGYSCEWCFRKYRGSDTCTRTQVTSCRWGTYRATSTTCEPCTNIDPNAVSCTIMGTVSSCKTGYMLWNGKCALGTYVSHLWFRG